MKTNKTRMINTYTVLASQHDRIMKDSSLHSTYQRMIRLYELFTVMCAEVAKEDEALARVYLQMGDFMVKEAYVSLHTKATIYGTATNSLGHSMTVTDAFFNKKGTLLLRGYVTEVGFNWYTLEEESDRIPVIQGYFDIVKCDWEVEKLSLELITLRDHSLLDIVPVLFNNNNYSYWYTLMTVAQYLEAKKMATEGKHEYCYIATLKEAKNELYSCSSYNEDLQQFVLALEGNNEELEYSVRQNYIQSIWSQLEPQDYYSSVIATKWISNDLDDEDYLPF